MSRASAPDGGVLYLREVDRQIGLSDVLASAIEDRRRQSHIAHQMGELLRQRAYQISCSYEDADDCDHLRTDPALKTAVGRDPQEDRDLGSQPTMTRLENAVTVRDLLRLGYAFEDEYCFMPFHVYQGLSSKYITSVLRAGKTPTAAEIVSVLKRIVRRIRRAWPDVVIVFGPMGITPSRK